MPPEIASLHERDLTSARRIFRLAFGTFLGAPEPENFWADRDYIQGRHAAPHVAAFAAILDGALAGTNFATRWGSVGFFGPLTVHPDLQDRGIAQALLARTMAAFDDWGTRHVGLFTFPHSTKHIALYQKYGFFARFLTPLLSAQARAHPAAGWQRFSALAPAEQEEALRSCREAAETVYPGLDLGEEIRTVQAKALGDTLLIEGPRGIAAFAICHYGAESEAGAESCYIKFGLVRDGASAAADYERLVDACEALAAAAGMTRILCGANMARHEAYRRLLARGYRTEALGVAMHRHNDPGYCRPGAYVIDDWR